MAVDDWSTTPNDNTTLESIPIADGTMQTNAVDLSIRTLMATIKAKFDSLPSLSTYVTKAAAVFTGTQPKYDGRGAYLHHNSSTLVSGRIFIINEGEPDPGGLADGDQVWTVAP